MERKSWLFAVLILLATNVFATNKKIANEPDSAYLFAYNANGLRFAWSLDKQSWTPIGNDYTFLKSDYGRWGSEKKMITPFLIQGKNGLWVCIWSLNDHTLQFATSSSKDLVSWSPQNYPYVKQGKNVLRPVIKYDGNLDEYIVTYADANEKYFQTKTNDLSHYSPAKEVAASAYINGGTSVNLPNIGNGQVYRLPWKVILGLKKAYELKDYKNKQDRESTKDDAQRFAGLKNVEAKITFQPDKAKAISNMLTGVFFEDLNYAADGGLYAELIQNRDFEYHPRDKEYNDKSWNSSYAWTLKGDRATMKIDSVSPIHPNNQHYAVLDIPLAGASILNGGFDGIALKKGETYDFSLSAKLLNIKKMNLEVRLVSDKHGILAKSNLTIASNNWKTAALTLVSSADVTDAKLEIVMANPGRIAIDMVSLFPKNTFKGRKNGLRADLAQTIGYIRPRFVRFPGGCLAHGDGIANIYKWKNSIGPLAERKPDRNLWGYHQTMGLGYYEYFQFCEDIGAAPVPVIAAGVPCQNSATGGGGQQGGIPMSEMDQYVQDIVDLIEYANGDIKTQWGKKRAEAGHPKPFNLKYVGIGNEDQITEVFAERFTMIYKALKKLHPEITVIGTAGPFFEGTDYEAGWQIASNLNVPIIDEHYYQSPGWFINNQNFYDSYDRSKSKVYLGEYAASLPGGNRTNMETSLAEALYLLSLERNGDVVCMASYAPLIAKEGHTQWNPDLIYFNNAEVKPTIGYFVQQLYGQNAGNEYIPSTVVLSSNQENVNKRVACSMVKDAKTGDLIVKLVNLLPVTVKTSLDFNQQQLGKNAIKTILTGNPDDKKAVPIITNISTEATRQLELPAYSFTVLRFKSK
ncbi:carbohydrate binding domain-containing protein [Pedobacter sp. PF22-3]|uniref:alpha-L-arabinofuranosidase C-terminal domain-containing protein n=1 Tax=Pedobacter sp. PF22-3 TaxID=2994467 RepID=UPI002246906C|nr:alpha-L-arabinofuranosidase C-terminal domain-containing protein [Pedobacter sp. PF22-3]MCX2492835.1 carbohydrate binding domain-containing protein [Pedobacter sp. PF22-3]